MCPPGTSQIFGYAHLFGLRCTSRTRPSRTSAPTTTSCIRGLEHGHPTSERTLIAAFRAVREAGGQAANATGRPRASSGNRCRRVVAMQANLEPAGCRDGRVLERLGQATGPSQAAVGKLNAPGVPDGPEDRLPVVPPHSADLEVVGWAEGTSRGRTGRLGRGRRIRWSRRRTRWGVDDDHRGRLLGPRRRHDAERDGVCACMFQTCCPAPTAIRAARWACGWAITCGRRGRCRRRVGPAVERVSAGASRFR